MTSVSQHYADHLAPIYVWMAGGLDAALALGASDMAPYLGSVAYAVDLGAGFGMHTIPLARAGARVLAVDTSAHLLATLADAGRDLPIDIVEADLCGFTSHLAGRPDLILCMGDTLTHLPDVEAVHRLIRSAAGALRPGGTFLATFRDYRNLPAGDRRFIPVRSDANRIHTCFLEERPGQVLVHDLIHERTESSWHLRVSSYAKLRLDPQELAASATAAGLRCRIDPGPRGMVTLTAQGPQGPHASA